MKVPQVLQLKSIEREKLIETIQKYRGQATTLESALGALIVGQHYGWRVLKLVHGNRTYNNYQKILGIRFEDICPERTSVSHRLVGLKVADALNSFWSVVRGKRKVPNKGLIKDEGGGEKRPKSASS